MVERKKCRTFATANEELVPWMSGLVNGLQNRLRRFESARHLQRKREQTITCSLFLCMPVQIFSCPLPCRSPLRPSPSPEGRLHPAPECNFNFCSTVICSLFRLSFCAGAGFGRCAAPLESGNELLFHCYLFPVPPPHNANPSQIWLTAI